MSSCEVKIFNDHRNFPFMSTGSEKHSDQWFLFMRNEHYCLACPNMIGKMSKLFGGIPGLRGTIVRIDVVSGPPVRQNDDEKLTC